MTEEEANNEQKVLVLDRIDDGIKIDPVEKINKNTSGTENEVLPEEIVGASDAEIRIADRNSRKPKTLNDDYVNDTVDRHIEMPKVRKLDKATTNEVIISAHALLMDSNNEGQFGMYLRNMELKVKSVPEKKSTHRFADWASEKKNSFTKIFSRFRSKK